MLRNTRHTSYPIAWYNDGNDTQTIPTHAFSIVRLSSASRKVSRFSTEREKKKIITIWYWLTVRIYFTHRTCCANSTMIILSHGDNTIGTALDNTWTNYPFSGNAITSNVYFLRRRKLIRSLVYLLRKLLYTRTHHVRSDGGVQYERNWKIQSHFAVYLILRRAVA